MAETRLIAPDQQPSEVAVNAASSSNQYQLRAPTPEPRPASPGMLLHRDDDGARKAKWTAACRVCTLSWSCIASVGFVALTALLIYRYITQPPFDVLFVLHDAGETLFVVEAIANLAASGNRIGVLALGQPAQTICAAMPNVTTHTPHSLGVHAAIADGRERNATLTALEVDLITTLLGRPSVVVVGMAYTMQAQFAKAFRSSSPAPDSGCWAVGIEDAIGGEWDAVNPLQRAFLGPPASNVVLDETFVADSFTASNVSEQSQGRVRVTLTGSGTIDAWQGIADDLVRVRMAREEMLAWQDAPWSAGVVSGTSWPESTLLVVFAGGYGGEAYLQGLSVFCEAAKILRSSGFGFVFSPHPGYPSSFERSLFAQWGCLEGIGLNGADAPQKLAGGVKVVDPMEWVANSTAVLTAAANASISYDSTVGAQSLAIGKPHAYLSPSKRDVFTAMRLIPVAPSVGALIGALNVSFRAERFTVSANAMALAGVPLNGTLQQVARLQALLQIKDGLDGD